MSHEIRTPLNGIIGFLRELKRLDLNATQNQFVENSYSASQHLLSIINNILDISKIESGEMSLNVHSFSIKKSIHDVLTVLESKAKEKGIKLKTIFADYLAPQFKGDSLKIEQIFYNILGNSLKFTDRGEIVIDCAVLKDSSNYQTISIIISDTGIGMSEEYVKNIFKKFNQEDGSVSRKYGGTGLGMAITKELVTLMKGKIEIESTKNVGTKTTIILNLEKSTEKSLTKITAENNDISIKGVNVLLVEDNEINQLVAENSLRYLGCKVTKADNGHIAIDILAKEKFDIILMDIQMPELDGVEATKILRNKLSLKTPIIALTANAFRTEIDKCMSVGMNDYITKPFNEEELLKIIYKHTKNAIAEHEKDREQKLYNLSSIEELARGDEEFIQKMLSIFITQIQETIPLVDKAFKEKDYAEISRLIHKIKPSIEGFGIYSIKEKVKDLEMNAKEKSIKFSELYELFKEIKSTLIQVIEQLQEKVK